MSARIRLRWLQSCFWLLLPILAFNVAFASALPPAYQGEVFWHDIPTWVSVPEHGFRILMMCLTAIMALELRTPAQRLGLGLFAIGTVLYVASWTVLIVWPDTRWAQSSVGFVAPAWTPAIWLAGLTLLGERAVDPRLPWHRVGFGVVAACFLAFHITHVTLVFQRGT